MMARMTDATARTELNVHKMVLVQLKNMIFKTKAREKILHAL